MYLPLSFGSSLTKASSLRRLQNYLTWARFLMPTHFLLKRKRRKKRMTMTKKTRMTRMKMAVVVVDASEHDAQASLPNVVIPKKIPTRARIPHLARREDVPLELILPWKLESKPFSKEFENPEILKEC